MNTTLLFDLPKAWLRLLPFLALLLATLPDAVAAKLPAPKLTTKPAKLSERTVVFEWKPATTSAGANTASYAWKLREKSGSSWVVAQSGTTSSSDRKVTLSGLKQGQGYRFDLVAKAKKGSTDSSPTTYEFATYLDLIAVTLVSPDDKKVVAAQKATLKWKALPNTGSKKYGVDYYTVALYENGSTAPAIVLQTKSGTSSSILATVNPSSVYSWTVVAFRAGNPGPVATPRTFGALPSQVTGLKVDFDDREYADTSLRPLLAWKADRMPVAGYEWEVFRGAAGDANSTKMDGGTVLGETKVQMNVPLAEWDCYWFRVRSFNGGTIASWSAPLAFASEAQPPTWVSPESDEDIVTAGTVRFEWRPIFGALVIKLTVDNKLVSTLEGTATGTDVVLKPGEHIYRLAVTYGRTACFARNVEVVTEKRTLHVVP